MNEAIAAAMVITRVNANEEASATDDNNLEELLRTWKDEILCEVQKATNELTQLRLDIETISESSKEALTIAKKNEADIASIQTNLCTLQSSMEEQKKVNNDLAILVGQLSIRVSASEFNNCELSEQLEDARNRLMRKTLIFKGINEIDNETWEDTAELVAEKISSASEGELSFDDALNSIERAHRTGSNTDAKKDHRDITAALYDWQTSEDVKKYFMQKNLKDRKFNIYCEQKYGPKTTARRNIAM